MNYECSICLEKYKIGDMVKELGCMHYFHESCIMRWAESVSDDNDDFFVLLKSILII